MKRRKHKTHRSSTAHRQGEGTEFRNSLPQCIRLIDKTRPVESQIETVSSVGAELAPDRPAEPSWLQADPQSSAGTTEPSWHEMHTTQGLPISVGVAGGHCLSARVIPWTRRTSSIGNCTQRRSNTSSDTAPDTPRQVVRDTPHLFIPAREASFPFPPRAWL